MLLEEEVTNAVTDWVSSLMMSEVLKLLTLVLRWWLIDEWRILVVLSAARVPIVTWIRLLSTLTWHRLSSRVQFHFFYWCL